MKTYIDEDLNGSVNISVEAISTIAGSSAVECFGVVGMATVSLRDGFVKLLKGDALQKGIEVQLNDENHIDLKLHIVVAYGVNIYTVCENLMSNVKYKVEEATGLSVDNIKVYVEGVKPID